VVRSADCRVAMKGHEHCQEDGCRQRHEVERPEVGHGDHVEVMKRAVVVDVDVEWFQRVHRKKGDEN